MDSGADAAKDGLDERELRRLLEAGRAMVSELDLEAVLAQALDAARELTGARYAALGVLDSDKRELERFLFVGIDEQTRAEIGPLPRGHGLLGELIRKPEPLRLERISEHPRSYGFPAAHPPMTTFLGVPITVHGEVYGNLYLTDKAEGAPFDQSDEELLVVLAQWVAVAIHNARVYEAAERDRLDLARAARGLQATASLSHELSGEADMERVFELIVKRGRALVDARTLALAVPSAEEFSVASCAGDLVEHLRGRSYPAAGSPLDDAVRSDSALRFDAGEVRWFETHGIPFKAALVVPIRAGRMNEGVLMALDRLDGAQFSGDDELVLSSFAASAAAAIGTSRALGSDRQKLSIEASERERRRWARELHDETMQQLGSLKVMQESALALDDQDALRRALIRSVEDIETTLASLDALITELRPASLDQLGTAAAIETLVEQMRARSGLEISADVDLAWEGGRAAARPDPELESAVYRIVQEALNNVIKHAGASSVQIAIVEDDAKVTVTVEDDGDGIERSNGGRQGFGLIGMQERAEQLGGQLEVGAGASGGTRVTARLPAIRRAEIGA